MGAQAPANEDKTRMQRCVICEREYESPDMAHCPAYRGAICSLCCTLDARCGDLCKPQAALSAQWSSALRWLLPKRVWPYLDTGLGHFILLMLIIVPLLATVFGMFYRQELTALTEATGGQRALEDALRSGFFKAYMALLLLGGIVAWWLVLAHKSRQVAQEESNRQTHLLMQEIESHRQTDEALQEATAVAERAKRQAEQANQAKSRYISAISHELRTPLNSILGYAQLMGEDASIPAHRKQAVSVIKRGGEHLLSLIEGTLDMAQIESGKLTLNVKPMQFANGMYEIASLFELQAAAKGLAFRFEVQGAMPEWVRADEKRVRQIVINLLGNAIKFTQQGGVTFRLRYAREMAQVEVHDTGPGMLPNELDHIFDPFARAASVAVGATGSGLGLTIAKMLTDLMGGELTATSQLGQGSMFRVRLFLPELHNQPGQLQERLDLALRKPRHGYEGARRKILVVDNEEADRDLLVSVLEPLGFMLRTAASGHDGLDLLAAGYDPDVVLLDLAMPGIDGWETLRRMRSLEGRQPLVAIVSANAFERGVDNQLGIAPDDFIVKPVRHTELLDWLGRKLELNWLEAPDGPLTGGAAPEDPGVKAAQTLRRITPPSADLLALLELVQLGFYRGITNKLDAIVATQPQCQSFAKSMGDMARQFQFQAMQAQLQKDLDEHHASS